METEIIDKLFLELSQVTQAKTAKEIACKKVIRDLCEAVYMLNEMLAKGESHNDRSEGFLKKAIDEAYRVLEL